MSKIVIGACLGILLLPGIVSAASWTDTVKVKGDFRYRHEMIKTEGSDARNRERIRVRIGIEATPTDNVKLGFQLATGSDDPISRNLTLDGGFTAKPVWFDLAYVDLHTDKAPGLNFIAGKMKNPFQRPGGSQLIWDGDMNPEGGAMTYVHSSDRAKFFANVGGFWVDERSKDSDGYLFGSQAGVELQASDKVSITGGFSYFDYGNIQGYAPVYDDDSFGNTLDEAGHFMYDYNLVEVFGELGLKAGKTPVSVFMQYVKNVADSVVDNQGWMVGGEVGKLKDRGSWTVSYKYLDLEADAVFATYPDSDFVGGGTNGKGSIFGLGVQVAKAWTAGMTYFLNETSTIVDTPTYHRMQLDMAFKF